MPTIWEAGDEVMQTSQQTDSAFSSLHISEKEEDSDLSTFSLLSACEADPISEDTDDPITEDMDEQRDDYEIEDIKCDSPVDLSSAASVFKFPGASAPQDRPLYSQIVKQSSACKKTSCASEAFEGLVQHTAATGRAC